MDNQGVENLAIKKSSRKKFPLKPKNELPVWHYTIWPNLLDILRQGEIRACSVFSKLAQEIPAVWFSVNQDWEPTVRKSIIDPKTNQLSKPLGRKALIRKGCVVARIRIDSSLPLGSWAEYSPVSGLPKYLKSKIKNRAKRFGAKREDWRVLFVNVPAEQWLGVEIFNDNAWLDLVDYLKIAPMEHKQAVQDFLPCWLWANSPKEKTA